MTAAFWRAFASCWNPRVLLWSLLPLLPAAALVAALGWAYWNPALDGVRQGFVGLELPGEVMQWLEQQGGEPLRQLMGQIVVVSLSVPLVMLLCLLLVALVAVPALARHVVRRRFPELQALRGASPLRMALRTLVCVVIAVVALVLSVPLWLLPPLVLLVPLLIWGWLTSRVLSYGVLAGFASTDERRWLLHRHRWALFAMGLVCAGLASLPSLLWAAGAPALGAAPLLGPVLVWLYTAVFVFAALWFAHFLLLRLQQDRAREHTGPSRAEPPTQAPGPVVASESDTSPNPASTSPPTTSS